MTCESPCDNCNRAGLPILFTRYAVAYSAQDKGMAALRQLRPTGQLQAQPSGVALKTALYNVRMLRAGYLYLLIEIAGEKRWEGYAVHPHGYLTAFPVSAPETAKVHVACARDDRQANASMVWVRDATRVKKLWYMFHPDVVDYEHLKKEVEPNLGKYMQSFDVASWTKGNLNQADACQPGQLNGQVVEFSALTTQTVRDACGPLMFGLMGSNAQERGWGDYEEEVEFRTPAVTAMGDLTGFDDISVETRKRVGPTYEQAHGQRLRKMAEFLQANKGAVAACNDAIGICQELGHLQSVAQTTYAYWQVQQAPEFAKGVTNEWVLQTSLNAQSLQDLVKKGAIQSVNAGYEESKMFYAPLPHDPREREAALATRNANREYNKKRQLDEAIGKIDGKFSKLFDRAAAKKFADNVHQPAYDTLSALRDKLGTDQGTWLVSPAMLNELGRYSDKDSRIDKLGGGVNLSLQLAQCMAGLETNTWGRTWLSKVGVWDENVLSRMLCFNSKAYLASLKQAIEQQTAPSADLPAPEASTSLLEGLATKLKFLAGRLSLGDKALAFLDQFPSISESARLRKLAWPAHVMTLLSVKMASGLSLIPVTRREAQLVRYMALAGVTTLGRTVDREAERLQLNAEDIKRARARATKLTELSTPQKGKTGEAAMARVRKATPGTRAAMLAGVFDFAAALLKGGQLAVSPNGRTATEMAGNVLQGIGSIADWRAKAYEETIFKGIKGANVYKYKALETGLDALNLTQLRALQKMAFKWLLPAALISIWFDGVDASMSIRRNQDALAIAQITSVFGTIFTIAATAVVAFDISVLGVAAASLGAVLGLIGAVLVVAAIIAIALFKEEEWVNWLSDCPLNKSKKPNHENLQETLQKFANVQAELQPAN
ncbi:hypothetical protein CLU95_2720 [Variovorax sp. 54]|uniref:T6SS effector BTH_I2691 family protein n=1 Tax=Variovorax sp. 54 TaxID=2035212 RepID=UPI000C1A86D7|nr:T6SS effector BTH_I2691 family protein [Variovorax sp. 54]PIF75570.1 hypothetical protein CLU95_2720 [Variovorax sp. 54]